MTRRDVIALAIIGVLVGIVGVAMLLSTPVEYETVVVAEPVEVREVPFGWAGLLLIPLSVVAAVWLGRRRNR